MAEEQPKKKRKWVLWTTILSILVFLISPFILYRARNSAAFSSRVNALADAGYPTSLDDLEKAYVLPEGAQNAADLYIEAFRLYVEPNETERELLPVRGDFESTDQMPPYPQKVMDTIKASLDKNQQTLELLDKAARMEYCLFPRKYEKIWYSFDYSSELRLTAKLNIERNLYLAQTGQTEALFESTLTSMELSDSLSEQPYSINHLTAIGLQALAAQSLENSLNTITFTEEQLAAFQQRISQMRQTNTMQTALANDRIETIELFNLPGPEQVNQVSYRNNWVEKLVFIPYDLSGLRHRDGVLLLDFYDRYIQAAQLPPGQQMAVIQRIKHDKEAYTYIPHWFLNVLGPWPRIMEFNLRVIGSLQCAETALAIERYRLKYKQLPPSLEALLPEFMEAVPLDPFDGKPIRYIQHDSGGYTVYAIGEDGVDNGGLDLRQTAKKTGTKRPAEYDWPFTVKH